MIKEKVKKLIEEKSHSELTNDYYFLEEILIKLLKYCYTPVKVERTRNLVLDLDDNSLFHVELNSVLLTYAVGKYIITIHECIKRSIYKIEVTSENIKVYNLGNLRKFRVVANIVMSDIIIDNIDVVLNYFLNLKEIVFRCKKYLDENKVDLVLKRIREIDKEKYIELVSEVI